MNARTNAVFDTVEEDHDRSDYFYDMLGQLLLVGQQAGGNAAADAALIAGLIACRRWAFVEPRL